MFVAPRRKNRTKSQASVHGKQAPAKVTAKSPRVDTHALAIQNTTNRGPPPYTVSAVRPPWPVQYRPNHQQVAVRLQSNSYCSPPTLANDLGLMVGTGGYYNIDVSLSLPGSLQVRTDGMDDWDHRGSDHLNRGPAICDLISSKFDAVITSIDGEVFSGDERELIIYRAPDPTIRGGSGSPRREVSRAGIDTVSNGVTSPKSSNYFTKVHMYANSRLPPRMPELKLYIPSYPLICLAAQFSQRAYTKPTAKETEAHVSGDWRMGTKAMVIKSIPIDDMDAIVFAIRGSQTFMDWAVNLKNAPSSPLDFLDDSGNLCHSGFLSVARKMIMPVAARLRSLLKEDPSRRGCSLIMTGHSAGGAVASLLYAHMIAEDVRSELNILTRCFKRIHCITFGSPPISLLPLTKSNHPQCQKSLFLSFINEGDPVTRAVGAYIRSLFKLYALPTPGSSCLTKSPPPLPKSQSKFRFKSLRPVVQKAASAPTVPSISPPFSSMPVWRVPPNSLSNAGRLVILRSGASGAADDVTAVVASDQQLRNVIFGDPMMHMMRLYAQRIEVLATKAITAKVWG